MASALQSLLFDEASQNAALNDAVSYGRQVDRQALKSEIAGDLRNTLLGQLLFSALNGAAFPKDAWDGKVDPSSAEGIDRAADLAGLVTLGSFGMSRPAGSLGMGARSKYEREGFHPISNVKLRVPVDEVQATIARGGPKMAPEKVADFSNLQGGTLVPAFGDRTRTGGKLTAVNDFVLDSPVVLEGGHGYMRSGAQFKEPAAWASGDTVISRLSRTTQRAANEGRDPYLVHVAMAPQSGDFSHMVSDPVLQMLGRSPITKEAASQFDDQVRARLVKEHELDPAKWPGVLADDLQEKLNSLAGPYTTEMLKVMDTRKFQDLGFPDVASVRVATTDPKLLNAPNLSSGASIAKLDPSGARVPSNHSTYPVGLKSEGYVGGTERLIPPEILWRDFFADPAIKALPQSQAMYSFGRKVPTQKVDQQLVDAVETYLEQLLK